MYGYGWDGWGMGGWIVMALVMLVFWGGVIALIVFRVRRGASGSAVAQAHPAHHDAERILHERFARGEIDETEYLARRAAIRRPE